MNPTEQTHRWFCDINSISSIGKLAFLFLFLTISVFSYSQSNLTALKTNRLKTDKETKVVEKLDNHMKEIGEKIDLDKKNPQMIYERCGTMQVEEMMKQRYSRPSIEQFERWMEEGKEKLRRSSSKRAVTVIPVVIHVIHNGEGVGNITDAQALSQITVLNEDFRRLNADAANTPTDFLGVVADLELEFCLATVDPDGNPTNGIHRYDGGQASYSIMDLEDVIKPATAWNPEYYFNIWCAPLQGGLLGYAQFPSASGLAGMPVDGGPDYTDGIVVRDVAFGNTGTAAAPFNLGRTATHEVGHFFGLRHIWGDGGCGVDDFCADTPTQGANNGGLGLPCTYPGPNSCNDGAGDLPDQFMNFMDYSDDACTNMYTADQKVRANVVLANSPRRAFPNSQVCQGIQAPFWEPDLPDPPANDLCDDATPIDCGDVLNGTNIAATTTGAGSSCGTSIDGGGAWYSFTGDGSLVTVETCNNADYDTKLHVFSGSCGSLTCIAGNDDFIGCSGFTSEVTITTVIGTDYYVYVSGFGGAEGNFTLSMTCDVPPPPPPGDPFENDLCIDAKEISCNESVDGTTVDATIDDPGVGFCGTGVTSPGVWYSIQGTGGIIVASTCNAANYDTKLNVYSGICASLTCVAGNDDGPGCSGFTSELSFQSVFGTTYYILVSGFGGATGDFTLSIDCPLPPPNDLCDNAIVVNCGDVVSGNTDFATAIGVPATDCYTADPFSDDMGPGVWYSFMGTGEWIQLSTCDDANFDTKIDVFTGGCGSLSCVAGNDDGEECGGFTSAFGFQSIAGVEYYIYVSGFTINGVGTSTGDFNLSVCPGCNISDVSLDPFWTPDGGLFCQSDGTYFASYRIDGIDINSLPRNGDGSIDVTQFDVMVNGVSYPVVGVGFDNISVPGVTYLYFEVIGIPGDGDLDADVKISVRDDCMYTATDLYDEPLCPCFVDAGPDQIYCIGLEQVELAAISGGAGMWTIVDGGNGTFGDATSPVTTYFTDFNDIGNVITLRWTLDGSNGCPNNFDEVQIDFASCIPTMSTWGIIVLSLLLLTFSIVAIRSRKILMS